MTESPHGPEVHNILTIISPAPRADNSVITSVNQAHENQIVRAQLADGNLLARIESVTPQEKK